MARIYPDRVGFYTPSTGDTGSIAVGSRLSPAFRIPSEASVITGNNPVLLVQEGSNFMIVDATYTSTPSPALSVDQVIVSVIDGAVGTTRMSLAGAAEVRFLPPISTDLQKLFIRTDIDQSALLSAAQVMMAQNNLALPAFLRGHIRGLALSAAGGSGTFGVAVGAAADSGNAVLIRLASAFTKTTSAWALGTGNGALDTGTIANNTWYHAFLIQRSDTGVVDVVVSTSISTPSMPANYDRKRYIGSMKTDGSAQWRGFTQLGDTVIWKSVVAEQASAAVPTSATLLTLAGVPSGVRCTAKLRASIGASGNGFVLVQSPDEDSAVVGNVAGNGSLSTVTSNATAGEIYVGTNTSAQVRWSGTSGVTANVVCCGYVNRRGQDD